ncbi:hypothetical protein [Listeria costaricensis]|uniref:hypothetical protein n=1 Tax=Listeria costaricensis TaxID=2026604 RepID=UPI000C0769BD|nr:hypothetical protein [Listeria costaricensis]
MDNIMTSFEAFPKIMITVLILGGIGFLCARYGFRSLFAYGGSVASIGFSTIGSLALLGALIVIIANGAIILTCLVVLAAIYLIIKYWD